MNIKIIAAYLVSLTLLIPYLVAESIEPLSTTELASYCSHYAKDPNMPCKSDEMVSSSLMRHQSAIIGDVNHSINRKGDQHEY